MSQYHFISGLPRSGSTLLAALLRQNPAISAGISSPLGSLFHATRNAMGAWAETSVLLTDSHRERVLRGLFDSYYADRHDKRWASTRIPGCPGFIGSRELGDSRAHVIAAANSTAA